MASRVNVKFVVLLATVLVAGFAVVAWLGYTVLTKSGADYIRMGDAHYEAGEFQDAGEDYARAVNHERTNIIWLEKWLDAVTKSTPETEVEYKKAYNNYYLQILGQIAQLQEYDVEPQRAYLDAVYRQNKLAGAGPPSWTRFVDIVTEAYERVDAPESEDERESLRRYRGLARLWLISMLPEEGANRRDALEDLEAAAAADPDDMESAIGVVRWHVLEWASLRNTRRTQETHEALDRVQEEIDRLLVKHPNNPAILITNLEVRLDQAISSETEIPERLAAVNKLKGSEAVIIEALEKADPDDIDIDLLGRLRRILVLLRPEQVSDVTLRLTDRMLKQSPNNAQLVRHRGALLAELGRYEEAIDVFQKIVDMPDLPVSLDGLILRSLREDAIYQQAQSWLSIHDQQKAEGNVATATAALEQAKIKRDAIAQRMTQGEDSRVALLLDSKLALAEENYPVAIARLTELDERTADTESLKLEALRLLGHSLEETNRNGAALVQYQRILSLQSVNIPAMIDAARVHLKLHDRTQAIAMIDRALKLRVNDDRLLAIRNSYANQDSDIEEITDPLLLQMIALSEKADQDPDLARRELNAMLKEHPKDSRLMARLLSIEAAHGEMSSLMAIADDAVERFPNVKRFREYQQQLRVAASDDKAGTVIRLIEESDDPPAIKLVRKHIVYKRFKMDDEAFQARVEAEKIAPDNPAVIDMIFLDAIQQERWEDATLIAQRAARLNVDQADGLMFQARLEIAQGNAEEAAATLERAVEKLPYSPLGWRLLGQVQLTLGRVENAVKSLELAYKYQPEDPAITQIYIQSLMRLQRLPLALTTVRRAREFHPTNDVIQEMWLVLEEAVGDATSAIGLREEIYASNPTNITNALALTRIYMAQEQRDNARRLLDEVRAQDPQNLDAVVLDAEWHAVQGKEGVLAGRDVIREHIGTIKADEMDTKPYSALASYLLDHDLEEQGLAAYEQAAKYQSEEMEADRLRGEYLFGHGRYAEAASVYEKIIDAGADTEEKYFTLRRIEALVRESQYSAASETINLLGPSFADDLRVVLLQAEIAKGQGDRLTASKLLDQAVEMAPSDHRPFLKRAEFNLETPELFRDVIADLQQVVRLVPSAVSAYRMQADLFNSRGRPNDALSALRGGVQANLQSDDLRILLLRQLVVMRRLDDAKLAANQVVKDRPGKSYWLMFAGDIFVRAASEAERDPNRLGQARNDFTRATELFRQAVAVEARPEYSYRLARTLLDLDLIDNSTRNANEARRVIDDIDQEQVNTDPHLLIIKARALRATGDEEDAHAAAVEALAMCDTRGKINNWFDQTKRLFSGQSTAPIAIFMQGLTPPEKVRVAYVIELARLQLPQLSVHSDLIERLKAVESEANDQELADLYRVMGTIYYMPEMQDYSLAADAFAKGLAIAPNDLEFNNNLAYTRAKHLDDPQGALTAAEKAVELEPSNPIALDTLGWVYFLLGRYEQSQGVLLKAVENSTFARELIPAYLHRGQALERYAAQLRTEGRNVTAGDMFAEARKSADEVRKKLKDNPNFRVEYQKDLDDLMAKLNQAE